VVCVLSALPLPSCRPPSELPPGEGFIVVGTKCSGATVTSAFGPAASRGDEAVAFVQPGKFRSPVVLQHSDIILASILRRASPRNVGGLDIFFAVGFEFTFANSVSLPFCKGRHIYIYFFFPSIIAENCQGVDFFF